MATSFDKLRLEKEGFTVIEHFSGVIEARKGARRVFGPTFGDVMATVKANYLIPKERKGQ